MLFNKPLIQLFLIITLYNINYGSAFADNHGGTFGIHFSDGKETKNSDVMQRYSLLWSFDKKWLESRWGYLTGRWELSYIHWELWKQSDNTGWAINPVFRYVLPAKDYYYFFDLGVGVIKLAHRGFEKRDLGSEWLFEDKVAAGVGFGKHFELALSWVHYSNADLASANDGVSMLGINYTLAF
ncbi:acyloxyacyl hydrolase [Thalassomonas viridans]|uniref:Acyloxyacyl hydrolase n=1 Tax=Thalassomonas viridans TaxID=137584 RepID=A0AAE9Z252_9GAMM|nr:acyloxyacyl hydrolase [Thalassomonas viridans]WDE05421.1 acyloxyacyl hydrolase [Thalassomonas viridans]